MRRCNSLFPFPETEIVRSLLDLRESIASKDFDRRAEYVEGARQRLLNLVNSFFYEKLNGMPTIKAYMAALSDDGKQRAED